MRVGILTYGLDRSPFGIGRVTVGLLQSLVALPDYPEIVLLTTEQKDPHGLWDLFEHHPLPSCSLLPSLITYGNLVVADAYRRYRLDLIHDPNGIGPFMGLNNGARRIVTIHDAVAYILPETHNRLDNWRYHYQLPSVARRASMVTTVSECSKRDLVQHLGLNPEQVKVIQPGVDSIYAPIEDSAARQLVLARYGIKPPYILYVGGINARKNISRLFEAFSIVRKQYPEVTLVMTGKRQWQTGELDATFQSLNLSESVHYTGYTHDADLPALYSAAELLAFPSLYEGFGLPPLEAMACGTPVVTSSTSSLPEVVGDAALMVDPHDVCAIAEAMGQLLSDPALATNLRARGLARARKFTWDRMAQDMVAVYDKVNSDHLVESQTSSLLV